MILYPTETLYALGVNALDHHQLVDLFLLKDRNESQTVSWAVRDMNDIRHYAEVSETAAKIAQQFLPGELTLVLPARDTVPVDRSAPDRTVGFRLPADPIAQELVKKFMDEHDAPLTCTSANVSGSPVLPTPGEILQQFGPKAKMIAEIIDDGPRKGLASTVLRVVGDEVTVIREGEISEWDIKKALMASQD